MKYMAKNWKLKPKVPQEVCKNLDKFSTLAAQLLYNRGITDPLEVEKFINTKYEDQNDPFLFLDMQKSVDRIWQAILNNEGICIYGDYDADAVTANSVLQLAFRYLGVKINSYIPDRFTEGYGLNLEAFSKIKKEGSKVVITVDCGTNSVDVAEYCKSNDMVLIITDHHEMIGQVPDAFALINPKNPHDKYPYHEITGVGVAFKLACALLRDSRAKEKVANYVEGYEKWLLDLVAIGTVADCHSLLGENRILVKFGLKVLSKTRWIGLRALISTSGLNFAERMPDTYTLGFVIAPRLNAAGRLEHANTALHLVVEEDEITAVQRAQALEDINSRRQDQTARIMSEAREKAELIKDRKVLVIAGDDWNKGIVGLAAGKLAEEYHKPTIVLAKEGLEATGSARSVGEFSVVEALKHASSYLIRFGGHQQAAGLTLLNENFEKFYSKVLEYAEDNLNREDLEVVLPVDAELMADDINFNSVELINSLEPFGVGNPKPKFLIRFAKVVSTKIVGKDSKHLQINLQIGQKQIEGIYFSASDFAKSLQIGDNIDIVTELIEDNWKSRKKIKLRIIDIKKIT